MTDPVPSSLPSHVIQPTSDQDASRRLTVQAVREHGGITVWLAICSLAALLSTRKLWMGTSTFPLLPVFDSLASLGTSWSAATTGMIAIGLLLLLITSVDELRRADCSIPGLLAARTTLWNYGSACFVAGTVLSVLQNQHRLQPWAYHFAVLVLLLRPSRQRTDSSAQAGWQTHVIWLTASIYGWSAWSKLDASFLQTHGQQFVEMILQAIGLSTRFWSPGTKMIAAATLPVGELLTMFLLLIPRLRRLGLGLSLVMHAALLLAVGPWGFDHSSGVLLWNLYFIGQNAWLMWHLADRRAAPQAAPGRALAQLRSLGGVVLLITSLLPVLRSVDCLDAWPAWAVYASSESSATLIVHRSALSKVDDSLRVHFEPAPFSTDWFVVRIDRWSLQEVGAPLNPGARFELIVVDELSRRANLDRELKITIQSAADRWTGQRTTRTYEGREAIQQLSMAPGGVTQPRTTP